MLRHLLEITILDRGKESFRKGQAGCAEHCSGNRTVSRKVAITLTENGRTQTGYPTGTEE
jgi:hypothetical protein